MVHADYDTGAVQASPNSKPILPEQQATTAGSVLPAATKDGRARSVEFTVRSMRSCNECSMIKRTLATVTARLALALAVATLPAVVLPQSVIAAPADANLALVQRSLNATSSMTAAFTQTDRAGKVLTGTLTLKKPGKIRFQYEKGVPLLIVGDGKNVYFIDYSVAQVQRWPVGNSPLGVLIDPAKNISRYATIVPGSDQRIISVEVRDPKHPEYGRITMVFAREPSGPGGLVLQGWVALDAQNNRTTVRLDDQKFNVAVSDNSFRWNDPRRKTHGR